MRKLEEILVWLHPYETVEVSGLIGIGRYKPGFYYVHRWVNMYLSTLFLTTLIIVPVWALNAGQNDYFKWSREQSCLTPIEGDYSRCAELTKKAIEEGWALSPMQGHSNRYGPFYYFLIVVHLVCGSVLACVSCICCVFFVIGRFVKWGRTICLFVSVLDYYGFMWLWLVNLTVAISMAYTRFCTHGSVAKDWAGSFSMAFFITFYFVVIAQIMNLQGRYFDRTAHNTSMDLYRFRRSRYAGQAMFIMSFTIVFITAVSERVRTLLGFQPYDVDVMAVLSFLFLPSFAGTLLFLKEQDELYRIICVLTAYFITVLIFVINMTYKYAPAATLPAAIPIVLIWLALIAWELRFENRRLLEEGLASACCRRKVLVSPEVSEDDPQQEKSECNVDKE